METASTPEEIMDYKAREAREAKNIELARKLIKILDTSDYDAMKMIFAEDFNLYWGSSNEPISLKDFIPLHKMFYSAFPDYTHTIEDIFVSENVIVLRILLTATHKNEFQGIHPTHNKIAYKSIQILEIHEGRVKSAYVIEDEMTMMEQLGMELKMKKVIR
jgi:predicted ester cyclase